ncbi:mRNA cap guanine-N7 methyltransferase [Agrilus planipennis]|uniref:mRNA cap guanine-N(7) methyltransferase n=1 Tax=Agrilus planipennis TaxID=224129 RepID=A0A1W4XGK1_AGRPL|nr:mRNA cap guanine-N7 methyltransferase [Agrilus planipennis]
MTSIEFSEGLENETSTDDLEKTLVIVAADADKRNYEVIEKEDNLNDEKDEDIQPKSSKKLKICDFKDERCSNTSLRKAKPDESVAHHSRESYANIVATHYNSRLEKGLHERSKSRLFYLRNFHNWIKSMLINEYLVKIKDKKKNNSPIHVHDMCCGKGGDLLKWKKGSIHHLICSDIAPVSLDHCKSRYRDMQNRIGHERGSESIFSVEYIAADCTKIRLREKYQDPSMKLDLVSCQFAFHYSFESLKQAECMLHNAAECLSAGGYFIGTILDSNHLLVRARKKKSNRFGNGVYQVQMDFDINKPPLFGAKYHFYLDGVVDCPEFLIHFPTFVKLAKKYGLKLIEKSNFYDFYEKMKIEGKQLMVNMKALETYPPYQGASLVGDPKFDYEFAEEYIKNYTSGEGVYVGTLSKSEWEASSIYLTFAFEKVKNSWASDGTPIYEI